MVFAMDQHTKDDTRKMESTNEVSMAPSSTFGEESPQLDPHSSNFMFAEWLKYMFRDGENSRQNAIGVAYRNLNVYGFGAQTDYQKTFANYPLAFLSSVAAVIGRQQKLKIDILQDFEGLVGSGEMLLVLGRPGSGCSTLLKTLSGQTHGFHVNGESRINYQGIPRKLMHTEFRGKCTYQAESDIHFPHLTVAQTLNMATEARISRNKNIGFDRKTYASNVRDATTAALGLSETLGTRMGSDVIDGVSGGERKRVSIAELLVGETSLQCWDNSTRGLDSANALNFIKTLRLLTEIKGTAAVVSLYQASQDIFDAFDKVVLLYEGQQVFFGDTDTAKSYFTTLGFICSDRATTADFLTSLTNPINQTTQDDLEHKVPRTSREFAYVWKNSPERARLLQDIQDYEGKFPFGVKNLEEFRSIQDNQKAVTQRRRSPFIITIYDQVSLCMVRGFQRLHGDLISPISGITGNCIISIILGSMFYNLPEDTSSFFGRGALLFFTVLLNTFLGAFEGVALWDQRPIVEKHFQYAFYHPISEAIASMVVDIPNKFLLTLVFNIPFYFLANLRRTPTAFLTFYLFAFVSLLTGSMFFRASGALSRTLTQSIAPGAVFTTMNIIYTGFILPIPNMHPWLRWFAFIDPISYAFESLMINEFAGRQFPCSTFVPDGPGYAHVGVQERQCTVVGAEQGSSTVNGADYIAKSFQYYPEHMWRNLGIILLLMVFLCILYLAATKYISAQRSKGEVLVFRRGEMPKMHSLDEEESLSTPRIPRVVDEKGAKSKSNLPVKSGKDSAKICWDSLNYDIKIKGGNRRLLDDVEGWIKPGTLTALMGASGAGKTTLLNVLANRTSTGVVSGEKRAFGSKDDSFARKIGYAQQQDFHLPTSTVREALTFSALLRQSRTHTIAEKLAWVDEVIDTLDMRMFANAVIGIPGEGLNIEQRKRVTIGVELAARPELLLFLDEPTSGLDSDTAWSICILLRKLADKGQAILCTIHQPSGILFQMFDRLLFLSGGKSLYFGDIGRDSKILTTYFEKRGARHCEAKENPAEWLLRVTDSDHDSEIVVSWAEEWRCSEERRLIKADLIQMKENLKAYERQGNSEKALGEFAAPFTEQLYLVTKRAFNNNWRTAAYLYSQLFLVLGLGIFNGFSFFHSPNSLQGIQNQLFSVFIVMTTFTNIVQVIMPQFLSNRALYEARERPSRTYSWKVFILSNIIVEIPWQTFMAVILFLSWYYPLGMHHNAIAVGQLNERGGLMFLLLWSYMLFCSTFSQMVVSIMPNAATGINIASLLYSLSLIFCGVLVSPTALPRFWIFMYRATPINYFVSAMISTGVSGVSVVCAPNEIIKFEPPSGQSCRSYLMDYISYAGGSLLNPSAQQQCQFCPISETDTVLAELGIHFKDRWRNLGISLAYSVVNVSGALLLYWLFRVPKGPGRRNA